MGVLYWPLDKIYITQKFGERPEVYGPRLKGHNGTDFRTRFVDSPLAHRYVTACDDGICEYVKNQGKADYGMNIRIRHKDGSLTLYGHLSKFYITEGQWVVRGQQIGLSGNTGFSDAPHLHLGYMPKNPDKNNGYLGWEDPLPLLLRGEELKNVMAYQPDKELEEVKTWVDDNGLANTQAGFDEPILKRDLLRILYRFWKLFLKK